jgi:hypothetical protein
MPKYEGYNKLHLGYKRRITPTEARRGYVFISKDTAIKEVIGDKKVELFIDGISYGHRTLDKSGRIIPRNNFKYSIKDKSTLTIKVYEEPLAIKINLL